MGREANCLCEWNGSLTRVKALLESREMILRGELRKRIPFSEMKRLAVSGGRLRFSLDSDLVCLILGKEIAPRWLKVISTPPPSLAKKLGIAPRSKVHIVGDIDDIALKEALADTEPDRRGGADLVIARVDTPTELKAAFRKSSSLLKDGVPIWIVYPKGPGHAINESDVRSTGLAAGVVDVKVAAVSTRLTGLKFVARKMLQKK